MKLDCDKCAALMAVMISDGKKNDEAWRKAAREHADGKHPAKKDK